MRNCFRWLTDELGFGVARFRKGESVKRGARAFGLTWRLERVSDKASDLPTYHHRLNPHEIIRQFNKMAAIVVPALKRHTSSVIVMHGLGDRYVDMHCGVFGA